MAEDLLVVGAGVAGLALARALALRGRPWTLVERRAAPADDEGLGLNLPGNAVAALAALGLADEVLARGVRVRRREYRTASGRLLFAVDEERFWAAGHPSVCVHRGDLLEVLRAGVDGDVRWGDAVESVQGGVADARVTFASGDVGTYGLVVGADGVRSRVRGAVGAEVPRPSAMTRSSWRFVVPNPGVECWTAWSGAGGTLLLIPVDTERVYGYASSTRRGTDATGESWLRTAFAGFPATARAAVDAALDGGGALYPAPVDEVRCERWGRGRVVLVGDAVHATGPVWAQGAALALEDAVVLAGLLDGDDWSGVGDGLRRLRGERVAHVQSMTDRMSRLAGLPGLLRDVLAPVLGPRTFAATYGPLREPVA
ncbi:FAD-dependent monooxygenase [Cellulomonas sp. Leaf334]|uniref:FAD-dependent monooxygenase n=1 Tax=Cellulomonas sp. Leaf334 TaxID=1736339 RepID=UPI0006F7BD5E|nr:FAD-dependent monooxygenase [Cellulomonas sp. Leaf334]KQR16479.1 hypothetical protein ASF78_03625 [Cellulomonas sp. Leaf334]